MNAIVPFSFDSHQVRIVTDDHGEPMFVAKDLVEAVDAVWKGDQGSLPHVPEEYKGVCSVQTPGGIQQLVCLTEQGMYFYLIRSDKPKALPLQKMVSGEILPSIRKTGGYRAKPAPAPNVGLSQLRQAKALELVVNMAERLSARFPNLSNVSEQALFASVINPVVGREIIPLPVVARTYTATAIQAFFGVSAEAARNRESDLRKSGELK